MDAVNYLSGFYEKQGHWPAGAGFGICRHGPANREVHSGYWMYGGGCIYEQPADAPDENTRAIIDPAIDKYAGMGPLELAEKARHAAGWEGRQGKWTAGRKGNGASASLPAS